LEHDSRRARGAPTASSSSWGRPPMACPTWSRSPDITS